MKFIDQKMAILFCYLKEVTASFECIASYYVDLDTDIEKFTKAEMYETF